MLVFYVQAYHIMLNAHDMIISRYAEKFVKSLFGNLYKVKWKYFRFFFFFCNNQYLEWSASLNFVSPHEEGY